MRIRANEVNLVGGSFNAPVTAKNANYTVDTNDYVIFATGGTSGITITLPNATTNAGRILKIVKVDSDAGAITIAAQSGQTVNGAANITIGTQYSGKTLVSDGTKWIAF